jgi:hypothetical protein
MGNRKEGPPSTLRRAHGPKEALSSGLTGFSTQPRAASSINRDLQQRATIRKIKKWWSEFPELKSRFEEIAKNHSDDRNAQIKLFMAGRR